MSSVTVVYGPGRSVSVKVTPTTTLQAVLTAACEKMPHTPRPDSHSLVYNAKPLDLTLPIRFANLPQGAKLTLKQRSSSSSAANSPKLAQGASPTVKVALQLVGSSRIIADFDPSATLWDIIVAAENSPDHRLNLTNKFKPAAATSPSDFGEKKPWGSGFLQTLLSAATGSRSGSSSPQQQQQQQSTGPTSPPQALFYQQPVLLLLNKEYSSNVELQQTTLKSLGFTTGSLMIRFSYRSATSPTLLVPMQAADAPKKSDGHASLSPQPNPETLSPIAVPAVSPPSPPQQQQQQQVSQDLPPFGVVPSAPASKIDPAPKPDTTPAPALAARQVRVFSAPLPNSAPLSARIVLPESFYEAGSDDLKILVATQRARVTESEKGFSSRIKQEEEDKRLHAEFKSKYPRALIRFRFPDQVQVQATFSSHTETVADLYTFLQGVLLSPQLLEALIVQPLAQNLESLKSDTLFDAKLAPAAVVHVKLATTKGHTLDLLRPQAAVLAEDLEVPATKLVDDFIASPPSTIPVAPEPSNAASDAPSRPAAPRPMAGSGPASDEPKMPKWFLAGQKRA
ncbi:hypothetical protein GGI04_002134 [Coemansia thaxteri]|nr:hypothetical protein GGI04_002134 [Coemansia thaxteri]KAJ2464929.1 hypothetical protein GGI02_004848 [Coemansia sp. RSA 2322]